ncbi:MAG: hypothetical protein HFE44_08320 [Oscillospiraceae bacterium]|nr:hypothetical protein [Oscillospiraceae bacterium]
MKAKTRRTVKRAVPIVMAVIMVLSVIVSALSSAVTAYALEIDRSPFSGLQIDSVIASNALRAGTTNRKISMYLSNGGEKEVSISDLGIYPSTDLITVHDVSKTSDLTLKSNERARINFKMDIDASIDQETAAESALEVQMSCNNKDENIEHEPVIRRISLSSIEVPAPRFPVDDSGDSTQIEGSIAKPRMDIKVASSTPTSCKEGDTIDLIILLTYSKNNVSLQSSSISVTGDNFSVINGMVSRNLQYESYKYKGSENFTKAVRYQLQTKTNLVSGYYPVNIKVEYLDYDETKTYTSENSFNVYIEGTKDGDEPENPTKVDLPTPQLIVDQYSYASETGNDYIMAGDTFSLNLKIKNTSNIPVVNTVVTLEEGLGFTLTDSSNSIYLDRLGAGETMEQNISVRAKPNTSTPSSQPGDIYTIAVKFNYQYVNDKTYNTVTKDEKLAIPVVQKDRFEVGEPEPPMMMYVGEESSIELTFVNKGTTDVRNITAVISGNIQNDGQSQYIGNLPAGEESSVSFTFNAVEAGMVKAAITLTYEDSNDIQREVVKEFTVEAQEMPKFDDNMGGGEMMDPGMMEPMDEGFKMPIWGWILIGVGGVAVLVVVIVIIRKKRKAKKEQEEDDEDI